MKATEASELAESNEACITYFITDGRWKWITRLRDECTVGKTKSIVHVPAKNSVKFLITDVQLLAIHEDKHVDLGRVEKGGPAIKFR